MEVKKQKIISEFDGLPLEMEMFIPDHIKGIVQISHGMAEHKERYEGFMNYLAEHDFLVAIHDHRGHGNSVNDVKELGYFYTEDINAIVEDLHQITVFLKEQYPDIPVFLFSHSMGTLVSRNYIKRYDTEISKLVLCGPPTYNPNAVLALFMDKVSRKRKGGMYRNQFIHSLAFRGYDKGGKPVNSWLSSDENEVSCYNEDPLCGYIFTNNGFINLFKLMISAFSKKGWGKGNLQMPIFLIAGEEDPVIQNKRKYNELKLFLMNIGYRNIRSKLYPCMRHELLNEIHREVVYEDILNFLEEQ